MKSNSFKRNPSHLRGLAESRRKKGIPWEKRIYQAVLAVFVFFLLRYFFIDWFKVQAEGYVLFDKLDIQFVSNIRVDEFYVAAGDSVAVGTPLFSYTLEDDFVGDGTSFGVSRNYRKEQLDNEMQQIKILSELEKNKAKLKELKNLKYRYYLQIKKLKEQVYLGVRSMEELSPLYRKRDDVSLDIAFLDKEVEQLQKLYLLYNNRQNASPLELLYGSEDVLSTAREKKFKSPIAGVVSMVNKQNHEVALESEVIMAIHQPNNLCVQAFFEPKHLDNLTEGDVVRVKFPDGTSSKGYIKQLHFATYELPPEFQKKYEPTQRTLAADVYPLDDEELNSWKKYYKMAVEVSKYKYWTF